MAIFGFICALIIGLYLILAGVVGAYAGYAFTGRPSYSWFLAISIVGLVIIYFGWINKPFEIVIQ